MKRFPERASAKTQYFSVHPIIASLIENACFIISLIVAGALLFSVVSEAFSFGGNRIAISVSGHSMDPTLYDRQLIFADKSVDPANGDIILAYMPDSAAQGREEWVGSTIVKRAIGVPGDSVSIHPDNSVWVNGEKLDESYLSDEAQKSTYRGNYVNVTLEDGQYFVMGDNRGNSYDSRYFGILDAGYLRGVYNVANDKSLRDIAAPLGIRLVGIAILWYCINTILPNVICKMLGSAKAKKQNE